MKFVFNMHHPHSNAAATRLRLAALLLLGNCGLAIAGVGLLGYSIVTISREVMLAGTALMVLALVLVVVQWMAAARTGCPLCRTPVLAPKLCSKHRRAKTLLGSHRLRVAVAVVFRNQFRCPYCNESTGLEVRESIRRPGGGARALADGRDRI